MAVNGIPTLAGPLTTVHPSTTNPPTFILIQILQTKCVDFYQIDFWCSFIRFSPYPERIFSSDRLGSFVRLKNLHSHSVRMILYLRCELSSWSVKSLSRPQQKQSGIYDHGSCSKLFPLGCHMSPHVATCHHLLHKYIYTDDRALETQVAYLLGMRKTGPSMHHHPKQFLHRKV